MKLTLSLLCLASIANAELPAKFTKAIHQVESSGRVGIIPGSNDNGKALGPLQIHCDYWIDSGVIGSYSQCTNLNYSIRVMEGYFKRYCPKELKNGDLEALARIHNGGLNGKKNPKTKGYWKKVEKQMSNGPHLRVK